MLVTETLDSLQGISPFYCINSIFWYHYSMDSTMKNTIKNTIIGHKEVLADLEKQAGKVLPAAAKLLINCLKKGGCVFLCGNGGSAADCQHIAAELVGRFRLERKALPAVALTTDTSALTAIGNDYGFEFVFSRQVEALVKRGDCLWAFSTSGTSKNVLAAAKLAKKKGAKILAFTGKPDTPLEKLSDVCVALDGLTSTVQEIHQVAYHILCDLVEKHFANKK
jgi:D-sedoheptulose 7-phosphate isomerase